MLGLLSDLLISEHELLSVLLCDSDSESCSRTGRQRRSERLDGFLSRDDSKSRDRQWVMYTILNYGDRGNCITNWYRIFVPDFGGHPLIDSYLVDREKVAGLMSGILFLLISSSAGPSGKLRLNSLVSNPHTASSEGKYNIYGSIYSDPPFSDAGCLAAQYKMCVFSTHCDSLRLIYILKSIQAIRGELIIMFRIVSQGG